MDQIIEPGTRFTAMACHLQHALAVREDGSILAWGSNEFGQLNVPEPNSGFVAVACTADSSLGLKANGVIVAWGKTAKVAPPNSNFISIAANNWEAYAIRSVSPADITQDGVVDVNDLLEVLASWGPCPDQCPPACNEDIAPKGGNCSVDVEDLLLVIGNWG